MHSIHMSKLAFLKLAQDSKLLLAEVLADLGLVGDAKRVQPGPM